MLGHRGSTSFDDCDNLLSSTDFFKLLATFDLFEPIHELRRSGADAIWAPDLLTPSTPSTISPWVLAGDPCVERSRIPTAAIFPLRTERDLPTDTIANLYPGLADAAIDDVIQMESRLRGVDLAA